MINFQRDYTAVATTMRLQAVHNGQVVADCILCQPDGHVQALRLLALNPILHRLTTWLLRQNDNRAKQDIILRGALLVISGSVELVDRHHPQWAAGEFGIEGISRLHGRIGGAKYHHLIQGWRPSEWSCRCYNAEWLATPNRLPISGTKKANCCRHEVAWWLAGHLLKRGGARREAGNDNSLGYYRIVPAAPVLSLTGKPVDKSHPYWVWRIVGRTIEGEYQPVTYCLVRPFGNGTAGVVVKSINPGWQWRQGIAELLELAITLNSEMVQPCSCAGTTNKGTKRNKNQKPDVHSHNLVGNQPVWLPG